MKYLNSSRLTAHLMQLPAQSANLNPRENLCSLMNSNIRKRPHKLTNADHLFLELHKDG